jgi:hypothetical protein
VLRLFDLGVEGVFRLRRVVYCCSSGGVLSLSLPLLSMARILSSVAVVIFILLVFAFAFDLSFIGFYILEIPCNTTILS